MAGAIAAIGIPPQSAPPLSTQNGEGRLGANQNNAPTGTIISDEVSLSPEALSALEALEQLNAAQEQQGGSPLTQNELTEEEQQIVRELEQTDREVRAHEQAHQAAGGPYASAPTYETVTGPDGQEYAVAGEVQIDTSPIPGNPEATVRKLDVVIRAALAPADPSSQDLAIARQAQAARLQAQQQAREEREAEAQENGTGAVNPLDPETLEENQDNPLSVDDSARFAQAAANLVTAATLGRS